MLTVQTYCAYYIIAHTVSQFYGSKENIYCIEELEYLLTNLRWC